MKPMTPVDKLNAMMRSIRFAMFTTVHADGTLRARPMALVQALSGGEVLFLTGSDAPKVGELRDHAAVCVTFADPRVGCFISLSGQARLNEDRASIERLWSPLYQAWFPQGLEDPHLVMIHVRVTSAEYWDRTSSRMVALENLVKAAAEGRPIEPAEEHHRLEVVHDDWPSPDEARRRANPDIMSPVDEEVD
jgi:general stress protein 26